MDRKVTRSLVVPVYNNEENVPSLLAAVVDMASRVPGLEVVFVIDGSPDRSAELLLEALPLPGVETQLIRHSRNFGSFAAVRTGMRHARGEHIAVMAADLQEPPELVEGFYDALAEPDVDLVFGVRARRHDPLVTRLLSQTYWALFRRFIVPDMPAGGVDVFGCTAEVRDAVLDLSESNSSLVAQLFWVGYRRRFVEYTRREREVGTSGWSARRRFRYMADSVVSFSDLPILLLVWAGALGLLLSFAVGGVTLGARLLGLIDVPGFTTIVLLITFFFSLLLMTQGVIGMYLWRAFENTKRKPDALVRSTEQWPSAQSR